MFEVAYNILSQLIRCSASNSDTAYVTICLRRIEVLDTVAFTICGFELHTSNLDENIHQQELGICEDLLLDRMTSKKCKSLEVAVFTKSSENTDIFFSLTTLIFDEACCRLRNLRSENSSIARLSQIMLTLIIPISEGATDSQSTHYVGESQTY